MKVTINITDAQKKGIKDYLKTEFGESSDKKSIELFISGIVSATLQNEHECVTDYINKYES